MRINVVYHGAHNCGLNRAAEYMMILLRHAGHTVVTYPADGLDKRPFTGEETGDLTILHLPPLLLDADVYEYAGTSFNPKIPHVGCWVWETDQVPFAWKIRQDAFHIKEVWTPTKFVYDACIAGQLDPDCVKLVDTYVRPPFVVPCGAYNQHCRFLYTFDYSSVFDRKNPTALLRAYANAFGLDDHVDLVLKSVRSFVDRGAVLRLHNMLDRCRAPVYVIDQALPENKLLDLTASCDCYVSPHRGEGFGLTMVEAAYLAKPVIATGFGGNMDFMGAPYPYAVKHKLEQVPVEVPAYGGHGSWAEPDVDDLARLMRHVYERREEAIRVGAELRKTCLGRYADKNHLAQELDKHVRRVVSTGV